MRENLNSFDYFYFYGKPDLENEIASEILALLMQPTRSLFYSRGYNAAGVANFENAPNAIITQVVLPYDIVEAISRRNGLVSNGSQGNRDRRIAVSQQTVTVEGKESELDLSVEYILLADNSTDNISLPLARGL